MNINQPISQSKNKITKELENRLQNSLKKLISIGFSHQTAEKAIRYTKYYLQKGILAPIKSPFVLLLILTAILYDHYEKANEKYKKFISKIESCYQTGTNVIKNCKFLDKEKVETKAILEESANKQNNPDSLIDLFKMLAKEGIKNPLNREEMITKTVELMLFAEERNLGKYENTYDKLDAFDLYIRTFFMEKCNEKEYNTKINQEKTEKKLSNSDDEQEIKMMLLQEIADKASSFQHYIHCKEIVDIFSFNKTTGKFLLEECAPSKNMFYAFATEPEKANRVALNQKVFDQAINTTMYSLCLEAKKPTAENVLITTLRENPSLKVGFFSQKIIENHIDKRWQQLHPEHIID